MTQKMDKVAVPIKLRAIMKGFTTGWNDRYYAHDNSWWISFGRCNYPACFARRVMNRRRWSKN